MNNRQKIAFNNPCRYSAEETNKIYRLKLKFGEIQALTFLTLDCFGGIPRWHSFAWVEGKNGKLNLFSKVPRENGRKLIEYLKRNLAGVGMGEPLFQNKIDELHLFKYCNEAERFEIYQKV